jgi:anti-anti-sigma factor
MPARGATVVVDRMSDTAVLNVFGAIDMLTAPVVEECVATVLSTKPRALIFNLSGVQFFSAAGLELLVSSGRKATATMLIVVVASTRAVRRPIQLAEVDAVVPVYRTMSEAITAITA